MYLCIYVYIYYMYLCIYVYIIYEILYYNII